MTDDRSRFYAERDRRTLQYGTEPTVLERPVAVQVGEDAAATRAGQLTVLALVNMLARIHRRLVLIIPDGPLLARSLVAATDLPTACTATARAIDPFIDLELDARHQGSMPSVGIGLAVVTGLDYYLGADRFTATLATDPVEVIDGQATVLGGGLAACLGAAALFRLGHGHGATPRRLSLWDFREGDHAQPGPDWVDRVDVGDVLMVGAGAVCSSLCYWLAELGVTGQWMIVDGDRAELHNTNRTLGLLAADAGWPDNTPVNKAVEAARLLGTEAFAGWYQEWVEARGDARPDLVLPLANGYGVRHAIGQPERICCCTPQPPTTGPPSSTGTSPVRMIASTAASPRSSRHASLARPDQLSPRPRPAPTPPCRSSPAPPGSSWPPGSSGCSTAPSSVGHTTTGGCTSSWNTVPGQRSQHHCREGCAQILDESIRRALNAGTRWAKHP